MKEMMVSKEPHISWHIKKYEHLKYQIWIVAKNPVTNEEVAYLVPKMWVMELLKSMTIEEANGYTEAGGTGNFIGKRVDPNDIKDKWK